jgi:hypothetical protein
VSWKVIAALALAIVALSAGLAVAQGGGTDSAQQMSPQELDATLTADEKQRLADRAAATIKACQELLSREPSAACERVVTGDVAGAQYIDEYGSEPGAAK